MDDTCPTCDGRSGRHSTFRQCPAVRREQAQDAYRDGLDVTPIHQYFYDILDADAHWLSPYPFWHAPNFSVPDLVREAHAELAGQDAALAQEGATAEERWPRPAQRRHEAVVRGIRAYLRAQDLTSDAATRDWDINEAATCVLLALR
ncbi:hypothetical protein [Streptomyces sp. SID11385]|uniref:hypothetical protein n=1 Tax=Streptomyces sp. SID11385 TaxID=2706031 RepID=UPI0013CAFABA|nr:hypothetical protein [Streptomyces sp. SID11385]NEA41454.1 hypothetical protein [Streptomyces sp. SID11385]